ncbi:hypothetical protein EWM64_g804 [Hericium alpestre]|uniref:Phosphoribosyltransferase domain-containing protein n=1 Tax=Hericium alpestre TaxID=135208 RepID=A0A4Z0A819_9AGAM|nr:hypothetical protein EWM64_g804 [Hericium alpestre]
MGDALADEVQRVLAEKNMSVDVVIPVPDTSRVAALNLAQKLNLPYREGFIKNRYVGRTFIMPGQQMRTKNVRRKLNAMALEFVGKNVLLVDDSIVRGTTSKEIIQMAKDVGAKKVIVASCAPPIRYPNVYGIDMPSRSELVAYGRTTEQVADAIGADLVIFQTLDDLTASVRQLNPSISQFDCSVFTGEYVTGGVDEAYFNGLEALRADNLKGKAQVGDLGPLEGKGGGGARHSDATNMHSQDVSTFTFVFKSAVCTFQTLTGDGVVVYRAYMVWHSLWVVLFGGIMLCGVAVGSVYACSQASPTQSAIFLNQTGRWITSFYAATLAANFSCTSYRIWVVNSRVRHYSTKSLMPVLIIIIDAGALYSVTLFTTLVSFVCHPNGQYIVVDMVMPIISIAFYMVIIRVGLAKGINPTTVTGDVTTLHAAAPLRTSYREDAIAMRPMEVRITQFVDKDNGLQQSSQRSRSPDTSSGKIQLQGV